MRRTAFVLLAAAGMSCAAGPALAAAGDPATGYWARTRTGLPVPLAPPDPVPEGGTWVGADPSGPLAVSALRTDLAEGLVAVQLRLTVADSVGTAAVQACPSSDSWGPEQGGRLEGAPVADCSAPLEATLDGELLVVPLPPGLDVVNVLLRPAPGSAFSLTLERATAASVVTAPRPQPLSAPAPLPLGPPTTTTPGPAFGSPELPVFAPAPEEVATPPLLAAPELTAPAPPAAAAPQSAPVPLTFPAARPQAPVVPDDRRQALLALAVLALLGVQAVRLGRRPAVAPRALGGSARRGGPTPSLPVAVPSTRGVGRFRTVRARPPVRI